MIRKHNKFVKPKKKFESGRIAEENLLVQKYGLKNKKEIWKTLAKINYFRKRMMALNRSGSQEEIENFFKKLNALGLKVNTSGQL